MGKKYLKIVFFLFIILISCKKEKKAQDKQARTVTCVKMGDYAYLDRYTIGTPSSDPKCAEYQAIWKELFMEKNNLTNSYFANHIELCQSLIEDWDDGTSFRINYKIKVGWAIAYNSDQFIIKIVKNYNLYPALNLPRDSYLTKESIRIAVNNRAFSSQIITLSNKEILSFDSMEIALNSLIKKSGVNTLCTSMIYIDKLTGNFILEAWAQYENEFNSCIQGKVDLINGQMFIVDSPCFIN